MPVPISTKKNRSRRNRSNARDSSKSTTNSNANIHGRIGTTGNNGQLNHGVLTSGSDCSAPENGVVNLAGLDTITSAATCPDSTKATSGKRSLAKLAAKSDTADSDGYSVHKPIELVTVKEQYNLNSSHFQSIFQIPERRRFYPAGMYEAAFAVMPPAMLEPQIPQTSLSPRASGTHMDPLAILPSTPAAIKNCAVLPAPRKSTPTTSSSRSSSSRRPRIRKLPPPGVSWFPIQPAPPRPEPLPPQPSLSPYQMLGISPQILSLLGNLNLPVTFDVIMTQPPPSCVLPPSTMQIEHEVGSGLAVGYGVPVSPDVALGPSPSMNLSTAMCSDEPLILNTASGPDLVPGSYVSLGPTSARPANPLRRQQKQNHDRMLPTKKRRLLHEEQEGAEIDAVAAHFRQQSLSVHEQMHVQQQQPELERPQQQPQQVERASSRVVPIMDNLARPRDLIDHSVGMPLISATSSDLTGSASPPSAPPAQQAGAHGVLEDDAPPAYQLYPNSSDSWEFDMIASGAVTCPPMTEESLYSDVSEIAMDRALPQHVLDRVNLVRSSSSSSSMTSSGSFEMSEVIENEDEFMAPHIFFHQVHYQTLLTPPAAITANSQLQQQQKQQQQQAAQTVFSCFNSSPMQGEFSVPTSLPFPQQQQQQPVLSDLLAGRVNFHNSNYHVSPLSHATTMITEQAPSVTTYSYTTSMLTTNATLPSIWQSCYTDPMALPAPDNYNADPPPAYNEHMSDVVIQSANMASENEGFLFQYHPIASTLAELPESSTPASMGMSCLFSSGMTGPAAV